MIKWEIMSDHTMLTGMVKGCSKYGISIRNGNRSDIMVINHSKRCKIFKTELITRDEFINNWDSLLESIKKEYFILERKEKIAKILADV